MVAAGFDSNHAAIVIDTLIESNLRGIDSHGIARLPHYLRRVQDGSINPRPRILVEQLGDAAARVDGDHTLGQLVMLRAADEAVQLARKSGSGWVAVRNSSHCGALAYYGLRIADAGMIGFVFTHVDPMVLPFGARVPFCGTNPLCVTAPRASQGAGELSSGALCLDMATSKTPWNSVTNAAIENVPIPLGWAVDAHGVNTTEPDKVAALYPFATYKGSGLGLVIDVLCAMLSEAPFGPDIPRMYGDLSKRRRLGGLVGAIDISRFMPLTRFFARMNELLSRWTALPPAEPGGRVLFPGEPELLERQRRLQQGIPLGLQLIKHFDELASAYGVPRLSTDDLLIDAPSAPSGPHAIGTAVSTSSLSGLTSPSL